MSEPPPPPSLLGPSLLLNRPLPPSWSTCAHWHLRLTRRYSTGLQGNALITLVVSLATGFGHTPDPPPETVRAFFLSTMVALPLLALAAFALVIRRDPAYADGKALAPAHAAAAGVGEAGAAALALSSWRATFLKAWRPIVAMVLNLCSSILVASFYSYVPSMTGDVLLPEKLYYIRQVCKLVGW